MGQEKISSICWVASRSPAMPGLDQAEAISQNLEHTFRWVAATQVPEPSLAAFQGAYQRKMEFEADMGHPGTLTQNVGVPSGVLTDMNKRPSLLMFRESNN